MKSLWVKSICVKSMCKGEKSLGEKSVQEAFLGEESLGEIRWTTWLSFPPLLRCIYIYEKVKTYLNR